MPKPIEVLKNVFGYPSFRRGQDEVIDKIIHGEDVLAVMPTGAGKSLCYQIPAILGKGVSIIVSPLISLMKDQVDSLVQNGVFAASVNSSMEWDEVCDIFRNVRQGNIRLLYIAPERLEGEGFREFLRSLDISLIVVDEAHCVSQWGHDFRPSYLNIAPVVASLSKRPTVAAFTATATPEVRDDIEKQLRLRSPFVIVTGFDRENLFFQVEHPVDKMEFLLDYVKRSPGISGIIYCSTRKKVEAVCEKLINSGVKAVRYHAGLEDNVRRRNQEAFICDRAPVIVATNAFGMGIDKSNVRYVIHYNMPSNMDAYYQEAGRAGRDGLPADCILLFATGDIMTARFFVSQAEDAATKKSGYRKLRSMIDYCHTNECLRAFILGYFGEKDVAKSCTACGNCASPKELIEITTEAKKIISCVYRMAERSGGGKYGSGALLDVLRGSSKAQIVSLGFNGISTWGLLRGYSADVVREMINFLLAEGFLAMEDGEYPVVSLTRKSMEFLKNGSSLMMRKPEERAEKKERLRKRRSTIKLDNSALFEELRALRRSIADEEGIAPFIVFTDRALAAMCEEVPENEAEFLNIPGVGERKLERYGGTFIAAIKEWKAHNG